MAAAKQPGRGSNGAREGQVLKDPAVQHGPYKLLPYALGGYVVHDTRAPVGAGRVGPVHESKAEGEAACKALAGALAAEGEATTSTSEPAANSPADVGFRA